MTRIVSRIVNFGLLALSLAYCGGARAEDAVDPLDWPYWRGLRMDGVSLEKNLPESWDPAGGPGSNLLWKREIGSRSTPVVMSGKLYLVCNNNPEIPEKEGEKVVCLDAVTGEVRWETPFNVYLSEVPHERVGWSSVVADPASGNVFVQGVCGLFLCLQGDTGKILWSHSMHEEYGLVTTYGGRTNFPIVFEDLAIISGIVVGWGEMAKPAHRFLAFDKRNGQLVWFESTRLFPEDTTYSAPVITVMNGQAMLVIGCGDGAVYALQPRTGKVLWNYDVSGHGLNTSPLVDGNRIFCGHSEENLDSSASGALFCIDGTKTGNITKTGELWRKVEWYVGRAAPLLVNGRLYACDDRGSMYIVNPDNGELIGRQKMGTMIRSSPLSADGKIYMNEVNGRCFIFRPTEKGVEIVHKLQLTGEECHGSVICSHGRLYLPTTSAMYCLSTGGEIQADAPPPALVESPKTEDPTPASLQVVPCDVLLKPGMRQPYQVRLYNSRGRYLRLAAPNEVTVTIKGPGEIETLEAGRAPAHVAVSYAIPKTFAEHASALINIEMAEPSAKMGKLTATARVRVVPDLDWSFDFNQEEVPITWVGCRYRHVIIDDDLLTKLTAANPTAGQLYIYLRSGLVNTGAPALTYDDTTAARKWFELLAYLRMTGESTKPRDKEQAEEKLGPALQLLVDEKVLSGFTFSTWEREADGEKVLEPRLVVKRGERKIDGNGVLCKITTIPKGTRSQGWMGQTSLHDYTIQADVRGAKKDGKLPDIALTAQRYTLDLMGDHQQLEIRTWISQPERLVARFPFVWEADVWYTLKFRAAVENEQAVLQGKVWKRGEAEPAEWQVSVTDTIPSVIGSPGLFGSAKDAELFYDNLTVTNNK